MIFTAIFEGMRLTTGDVLCTTNGAEATIGGVVWRLIGSLVPGTIDHVTLYVGPGLRCIEAGPNGVIAFELPRETWDAEALYEQRGFLDTLYGVVDPLAGSAFSARAQQEVRASVARYCEEQLGKPYNFNFVNPYTDAAFYCSQLVYKAFLLHKIDLRRGDPLPFVLPQVIWDGSQVRQTLH